MEQTLDDLIVQGQRDLVCGDVSKAVENFQKACEALSSKHGDFHEALATPNLLYGTALLELSRIESTVIGNALDGISDQDGDDSESDDEMIEPGPVLTTEEKEDLSNQVIDAMCEDVKQEISEPSTNECPEAENEKNPDETSDSTDEDDNADGDDAQEDVEIDDQDQPADAETNKSDDEEDVSNLQIAWEVIEVARKIFSQKQDPEDKLNVAECLQKLGEISREKEDYDQAVSDLKECLEIRTAVLGTKDRRVAESHYQLGTTYAVFGDLEKASISFRTSVDCLKLLADDVRMKIGATDENDEVKNRLRITLEELELLIPDIEKRCADIDEDRLSAGLKSDEPLVEQCSNGSSVPTEDISHLVRKKRLTVDVVEKPKEDENSESNGHDHPKSKKTKLVDANENGVPVENGV